MRDSNARNLNKEDIAVKKAKLASPDPRERAAAASDLASYGKSAAAYEGLAGDVTQLLYDQSPEVRMAACQVLADMGEAAAEPDFVNEVIERLRDDHLGVRRMAIMALGRIGGGENIRQDVSNELAAAMEGEVETQTLVLQSLTQIGAESHVHMVADMLQSPHLEVRRAALQCLGSMPRGTAAQYAIRIADSLNEPLARVCAFSALANVGQAADNYIPMILPFLEDSELATRQAAVDVLGTLASSVDKGSVLQIVELLQHHNPAFRTAGAAALGQLGEEKAGIFAQAVKDLLYDEEQWELMDDVPPVMEVDMYGKPGPLQQLLGPPLAKPCCAAATALGKLGSKGQEYVTSLAKQFVWSDKWDFKIACMEALARMGDKGAEYSNYVARCIKERGVPTHVRAAGLLVLGSFVRGMQPPQGSKDEWIMNERINTSLARIAEALTDQDPHVQVYAVYAMGSAGPRAVDYIGQLAGILEDRRSHLLATAVKALGSIGPEAAPHADKVAALLEDERMPVRHNAAEALGEMRAEKFAGHLVARLQDPSCDVRGAAAVALGRLGQSQHMVSLARLLIDPLSAVRRGACIALGLLVREGGQKLPPGTVEHLHDCLDDDVGSVSTAAKEAWDQLRAVGAV